MWQWLFDRLFESILARLSKIEITVQDINYRTRIMANDLSVLQATITALEAKATETNATLAGLAQAIIDLKASLPPDVQPQIDALAAQAQKILDGLTAAEDAADDQLPPAA